MKNLFTQTAVLICLLVFPLLGNANVLNDREEIIELPGYFGVLHTENYEYVCKTYEGTDKAEIKVWLDVDFSKQTPYRLALGFANNGTFLGYKAIETQVLSYTRARCPGVCVSLTLAAEDGSGTFKMNFKEDPITRVILMTSDADKTASPAVCERNEIE